LAEKVEMKMNEIKLSVDLLNAVMQYLGSRPFVEVAGLIQGIQQQASAQGATPEAAPADPAAAPATPGA
jgi:hypothetical protein